MSGEGEKVEVKGGKCCEVQCDQCPCYKENGKCCCKDKP